jgi:hypothetical protein
MAGVHLSLVCFVQLLARGSLILLRFGGHLSPPPPASCGPTAVGGHDCQIGQSPRLRRQFRHRLRTRRSRPAHPSTPSNPDVRHRVRAPRPRPRRGTPVTPAGVFDEPTIRPLKHTLRQGHRQSVGGTRITCWAIDAAHCKQPGAGGVVEDRRDGHRASLCAGPGPKSAASVARSSLKGRSPEPGSTGLMSVDNSSGNEEVPCDLR